MAEFDGIQECAKVLCRFAVGALVPVSRVVSSLKLNSISVSVNRILGKLVWDPWGDTAGNP